MCALLCVFERSRVRACALLCACALACARVCRAHRLPARASVCVCACTRARVSQGGRRGGGLPTEDRNGTAISFVYWLTYVVITTISIRIYLGACALEGRSHAEQNCALLQTRLERQSRLRERLRMRARNTVGSGGRPFRLSLLAPRAVSRSVCTHARTHTRCPKKS